MAGAHFDDPIIVNTFQPEGHALNDLICIRLNGVLATMAGLR